MFLDSFKQLLDSQSIDEGIGEYEALSGKFFTLKSKNYLLFCSHKVAINIKKIGVYVYGLWKSLVKSGIL